MSVASSGKQSNHTLEIINKQGASEDEGYRQQHHQRDDDVRWQPNGSSMKQKSLHHFFLLVPLNWFAVFEAMKLEVGAPARYRMTMVFFPRSSPRHDVRHKCHSAHIKDLTSSLSRLAPHWDEVEGDRAAWVMVLRGFFPPSFYWNEILHPWFHTCIVVHTYNVWENEGLGVWSNIYRVLLSFTDLIKVNVSHWFCTTMKEAVIINWFRFFQLWSLVLTVLG